MTTYAYPEPRIGEKFMGWIDAAVAAKKIRSDIKQAQLHSEIPPDVKVSVRTRKYAGGQAVDVTLKGWNSEAVWYQTESRREWTRSESPILWNGSGTPTTVTHPTR